jgi:plasmid stability protein
MAQLLIRNLDPAIKAKLQAQAKRHGRSMEEECRIIIKNNLGFRDDSEFGLGTEIAAQSALFGVTPEAVAEMEANIGRIRAQPLRAFSFDEE